MVSTEMDMVGVSIVAEKFSTANFSFLILTR